MNYAQISDRPFATRKTVATKKKMSVETSTRREYIAARKFSVVVNPSTKQGTLKVCLKNER